ncbi:MAG: YdjY domain-containing protein [Phycisphaerae bacterium]|nr:YdjY domain-containing protein [Phycisphaerae bacterium]
MARFALLLIVCLPALGQSLACAADESPRSPAETEAKPDPGKTKAATPRVQLPGLHVNAEKGYVDVDGSICLTEGVLELIATHRGGKTHEAIFALDARPQHLHLALLMLGLKPGKPGRWKQVGDRIVPIDPTGAAVKLSVRFKQGDKTIERPVHEMVRNANTRKTLPAGHFVFAGSEVVEPEQGKPYYAADESGDVIAMVSFGDEVLASPKAASADNDALAWEANTARVPPLGTVIQLRIRPVKAAAK